MSLSKVFSVHSISKSLRIYIHFAKTQLRLIGNIIPFIMRTLITEQVSSNSGHKRRLIATDYVECQMSLALNLLVPHAGVEKTYKI